MQGENTGAGYGDDHDALDEIWTYKHGRPVGGRSLLSPLQRAILERQRSNASGGGMDAPDERVHAALATVNQRLERDGAAVAT